jgi:hypothetical protein
VLDRVEAANAGLPITFFEITTAAAFVAFAEVPADLCIVEVGLGGILDATNVVTPKVSVIAPVDIDHREFLGDTLTAIAGEKAGIIKPGAPAVSARQQEEAETVIEAAAEQGRRLPDPDGPRLRRLERARPAAGPDARPPARPAGAVAAGRAPVRQCRPGRRRPADPGRSAHRRGRHGRGDRRHRLAGPLPAPDRRARWPSAPRRPAPISGWTAATIRMPAAPSPGPSPTSPPATAGRWR